MATLRRWFLAPSIALLGVCFVVPLGILLAYSLLSRGVYGGVTLPLTGENWFRAFDAVYLRVLWRSLLLSSLATLICLVLAFPVALWIARARTGRHLWLLLIVLPFWTSLLIRTYAWLFLLRDTGLVNQLLLASGVIRQPLPLLYHEPAVLLGLVYTHLPFAVLPLYATLEKLDPALLEAAADLGATPFRTLLHVTLPVSAAGFQAATLLVLVSCLGAYLTPDLLGGGHSILIGNVVQSQFTTARDWPFGAVLSLWLLGLAGVGLWLSSRKRDGQTG